MFFISSCRSKLYLVWFPFNLNIFIYICNSVTLLVINAFTFCLYKNLTLFVEELFAEYKYGFNITILYLSTLKLFNCLRLFLSKKPSMICIIIFYVMSLFPLFPMTSLMIFLFIFSFHQFYYNLLRCGLLGIYLAWILQRFFYLKIDIPSFSQPSHRFSKFTTINFYSIVSCSFEFELYLC